MSDLNVDDFFKDSGRVLTRLYAAFPRPLTVYVEDIAGREETDEFGMHSDRHLACLGALVWLGEEGYLRYQETVRQEAIDQAVLTARAFTLLSLPAVHLEPQDVTDLPELVRIEQATNVHRLRTALKSHSSARIRNVMLTIMQSFAGVARSG